MVAAAKWASENDQALFACILRKFETSVTDVILYRAQISRLATATAERAFQPAGYGELC